jgi:ubiquinol-cytochrome c reductase iron-sulfur subunit
MAFLARTFASSLARRSHSTIPASGSALRHVSIGFSKDDQKDEAKRSNGKLNFIQHATHIQQKRRRVY